MIETLIMATVWVDPAKNHVTFGVRGLPPDIAGDVVVRVSAIAADALVGPRSCSCCTGGCRPADPDLQTEAGP